MRCHPIPKRRKGLGNAAEIDPQRTGTFTTSIIAEVDDHTVACS